jgi:hypothetical protein
MFMCLWCGLYFRGMRDDCPYCASEGIEAVTEEDYQNNRYTQGFEAFLLSVNVFSNKLYRKH